MLTLLIVYCLLLLLWSLRTTPASEPDGEPDGEPAAEAAAARPVTAATGASDAGVHVVRRRAALGG